MLKRLVLAAAIVAGAAVGDADAATYHIPFGGNSGSQTLGTPLNFGDAFLGSGFIQNQAGTYSNEYVFTLGANQTKITSAANWFALAPIANSLSYTLLDLASNLVAEDVGPVFPGNGTVSSSLVAAGLTPGATYKIVVAGTVFGAAAAYQLNVGVTPIPGAVLLLAPALAGLGYMGYRRRAA